MSQSPVTRVVVDLDAIAHNTRQVLARMSPGARLCAVVKANAYGHGMAPVAQACIEAGAQWLAVSTVEEGAALRQAGVSVPVLVFMPPVGDEVAAAVEHGLTATVTSVEQAMELRREAEGQERVAQAHVCEDLGLGRIGPAEPALDILQAAAPWPQLEVSGVYSHFGPPGSGVNLEGIEWMHKGGGLKLYATAFRESARELTERRIIVHFAASAMFLQDETTHYDLVRIGTLLYGQYPDHVQPEARNLDLRQTFELRSRIVSIHTVARGARIGYGGEFICRRPTRVGTVPVGFAHGLGVAPQSASTRWRTMLKGVIVGRESRQGRAEHLPQAQVRGRTAPLIGRVSMDQCCVDLTDIPEAARGDDVALPIRRVTTSAAIPRVYTSGGDTDA